MSKEESEVKIDNSVGPSKFERDEHGLLKAVQYVFNEDGSVDWRGMINEDHLFPNKQHYSFKNKELPKSIEGLEDSQLLIKLSGIKELAKLRGYKSVDFKTEKNEHGYVAVTCKIVWLGNYETGGEEVCFSDQANATFSNTLDFAMQFLETIACNRAFVRAVRNFLGVHIVGDDEIDKSGITKTASDQNSSGDTPAADISATGILKNNAKRMLDIDDFDEFKGYLRTLWKKEEYKNEEASKWEDFSDIPPKEVRKLLVIVAKG